MLDAFLASRSMDGVAECLSRGRQLESIDDAKLKQGWIGVLRLIIRGVDVRPLMSDIAAELSLRGSKNTPLPPDVKAAIAEARNDPEFIDDITEEIAEFFERDKAKN